MAYPVKYDDSFVEKLKELAATGITGQQAAMHFRGMSRGMILSLAARKHIQFHGKKFGGPEAQEIRRNKIKSATSPKRGYLNHDQPDAPLFGLMTFDEIKDCFCKYIFGDPLQEDHRYCGRERVEGYSYCSFHCRQVFAPEDQTHAKVAKHFRTRRSY